MVRCAGARANAQNLGGMRKRGVKHGQRMLNRSLADPVPANRAEFFGYDLLVAIRAKAGKAYPALGLVLAWPRTCDARDRQGNVTFRCGQVPGASQQVLPLRDRRKLGQLGCREPSLKLGWQRVSLDRGAVSQ